MVDRGDVDLHTMAGFLARRDVYPALVRLGCHLSSRAFEGSARYTLSIYVISHLSSA